MKAPCLRRGQRGRYFAAFTISPERMRHFILAALLLAGLTARGQDAPAAPAAATLAPPDTAAALHRLFEHSRRRRWALPITLAVGGGLTTLGATYNPPTNDPVGTGFNAAFTILAGTITTALVASELVHYGRYTHRREERALAQWQAHQLPPRLRRRLTARYFVAPVL